MVVKIPGLESIDMDAINAAVAQAVGSAGIDQLDLGSLGTSGQSVMEDEPITLAADPVAPVFDKSDVAGSLAAGLVPTQADILSIYTPFIFGSSSDLVRTFDNVRALEEAGYALKEAPSTSTISHFEMNAEGGGRFIPKTSGLTESDSPSPMSTMVEPEVTPMDSDIDRMIEKAIKSAMASGGDMPVQAADDPILTIDPVQAAVDAAVGNGQPTTDDTILNLDDMTATSGLRDAIDNAEREESKNPFGFGGENYYSGEGFIPPPEGSMNTMAIVDYYNPSTGQIYRTNSGGYTAPPGWISGTKEDYESNKEYYDNILAGQGTDTGGTGTETQQPDFMTQLQELIASMQAEQTAAAEAAAAAEAERQKQTAEMTQNYMVGQPAVGYNPYVSGQYQSDPYGAAGVPDMGGITSIPVPTAYTPNPYLIGGTT